MPLREAGAAARDMLGQAAAARIWNVAGARGCVSARWCCDAASPERPAAPDYGALVG